MVLRDLKILQKIKDYHYNRAANIEDLTDGIYQTSGNVTYAVVTHSFQLVKHFLVDSTKLHESEIAVPKEINQKIAERLDNVRSVNTLFILDIWKNVAFIPYFQEIVSLADILTLRNDCPLEQRHVRMLVNDIIDGISNLHKFKLQKGLFSAEDILLVRRQDQFYFQIGKLATAESKTVLTIKAGLENCKCLEGKEPTDGLELQSFKTILHLVGGPNVANRSDLISGLITYLSDLQVLGSRELAVARETVDMEDEKQRIKYEEQKAKHEMFPSWSKDIHRMELEVYFHAVRVLGTTVGGTFAKTKVTK